VSDLGELGCFLGGIKEVLPTKGTDIPHNPSNQTGVRKKAWKANKKIPENGSGGGCWS
jgi:hypothetical protein